MDYSQNRQYSMEKTVLLVGNKAEWGICFKACNNRKPAVFWVKFTQKAAGFCILGLFWGSPPAYHAVRIFLIRENRQRYAFWKQLFFKNFDLFYFAMAQYHLVIGKSLLMPFVNTIWCRSMTPLWKEAAQPQRYKSHILINSSSNMVRTVSKCSLKFLSQQRSVLL